MNVGIIGYGSMGKMILEKLAQSHAACRYPVYSGRHKGVSLRSYSRVWGMSSNFPRKKWAWDPNL